MVNRPQQWKVRVLEIRIKLVLRCIYWIKSPVQNQATFRLQTYINGHEIPLPPPEVIVYVQQPDGKALRDRANANMKSRRDILASGASHR